MRDGLLGLTMSTSDQVSLPEWKKIQNGFSEQGLDFVFRELLGWSLENPKVVPFEVDGETYCPKVVADLKGYRVFLFESSTLPSPKLQARLDVTLSEQAPEKITIFSDGATLQWRWPHQTPSGGVSFESLSTSATKMPSFLAQRLVGLRFTAKDFANGISLVDVRDRVRGRFDGAKVTKRFFDEFRTHHKALASGIEGLDSEELSSSYATLLLNRLMLLYFLQKREFLNDDPFYLENCLASVQKLSGKDKFYGFYRDMLLPMFFDRLSAHVPGDIDEAVSKIIGDIPYINGGIYEPAGVEKEFAGSLDVPDQLFENILSFFGKFNWHLDTRPSGSENEINPEVIGYIFEQYINYTVGGKKDNGAYYTKEDVTGYMVGAALVPRLLDLLDELQIPFGDLVGSNPLRYIPAEMLRGYDFEKDTWVKAPKRLQSVWGGDPIGWHELDEADLDEDLNLPGENWVETFYRRDRVNALVQQLSDAGDLGVNELVTQNLDLRTLLTDAIDRLDRPAQAEALWKKFSNITVLDPTCGSGAFLFAALEVLEDAYHHLLSVIRADSGGREFLDELISEVHSHPNERYFVRKRIALNNLYGTDVMPDAVETAHLRIFLALASCLENKFEIEPLPDLAFNLKCGNLLVGFKDPSDVERFGGDLVSKLALEELAPDLLEYEEVLEAFIGASTSRHAGPVAGLRDKLAQIGQELRKKANHVFAPIGIDGDDSHTEWVSENRPFHWFIEFPSVMRSGGFDVIIGNPPYIARRALSQEVLRQIRSYRTGGCPDIYAPCVERSLSLLDDHKGRFGFIVMSNAAYSEGFAILREVIGDSSFEEWWSTFGRIPDGLFSPARVRNTIIVLGPGHGRHVTRHHIFSSTSRQHLFQNIEYFPAVEHSGSGILRSGQLVDLTRALANNHRPLQTAQTGKEAVFLKPTATYWFPVIPCPTATYSEPGVVDESVDSGLKMLELDVDEAWKVTTALLGGKVQYFWWAAKGDDFHVNASETLALRNFSLQKKFSQNPVLQRLAESVVDAIPAATILVRNKGIGVNIRWSDLSPQTDLFDLEVLRLLGLETEWKNLNVWYRQSMRSSGPSGKDQPLDPREATSYLKLPED